MIRRLLTIAQKVLPASRANVASLRSEVDRLNADLNEQRADNLRIAQLHDLVVDRLAEVQRLSQREEVAGDDA